MLKLRKKKIEKLTALLDFIRILSAEEKDTIRKQMNKFYKAGS